MSRSKPPRFIIKPKYDAKDTSFFTVAVASDAKDEYGRKLGELYKDKPYWRIYATELGAILPFVKHVPFESDAAAANYLWAVIQGCEKITEARPLPTDLERYLEDRARSLREEEQAILSRFFNIRMEQHDLRRFAKDNALPKVDFYTEHTDEAAAVHRLLTFCREGHEEPFFSEASLYDLVGKEDARTLIALVTKVCDCIAPNLSRGIEDVL